MTTELNGTVEEAVAVKEKGELDNVSCCQCGTIIKYETDGREGDMIYPKMLSNEEYVCCRKCHREYALEYWGYIVTKSN
jgi:hypothetical protein